MSMISRVPRWLFALVFLGAGVMKLVYFDDSEAFIKTLAHVRSPSAKALLLGVCAVEGATALALLLTRSRVALHCGIILMTLMTLWAGLYAIQGKSIVCRCFGIRIAFLESRWGFFGRNLAFLLVGLAAAVLDRRDRAEPLHATTTT